MLEDGILEDNFDFFNMKANGKIIPSESKTKWEFIKRYTFFMLIFFSIYRIVFYIVNSKFMDTLNNFKSTITDAENYIHTIVNQSYKLSIICMALILCNFIVVIISSLSFFNKYSIKKDYCKEIQKTIIIIELIFIGVISFDFSVQYINKHDKIDVDEWRLETLIERHNQGNKIKQKEQKEQKEQKQIEEYIGELQNIYWTRFISLMLFNIFCAILCIFIQRNIIKSNLL